ncbi:hypothetical protein EXU30_00680 [Shewanella maritima]|uniref:Uncharacterized protein n=1 Tax=Shewanella maritima TaxID=2520507 RepID=A0A411PCT2_9GAMM|nr:hypothetical protein EXU30_00680 [Shewanella maritima]
MQGTIMTYNKTSTTFALPIQSSIASYIGSSKKLLAALTIATTALLSGCASTDSSEQVSLNTYVYQPTTHAPIESIKMFPAPVSGMKQHIIEMPPLTDESRYMVEFQLGKTMLADCNLRGLWGS